MKRALGFMNKIAPVTYNTEIGGVSASISSASALATKLGISVGNISNFTIVGSDIKCRITGSYGIPALAFAYEGTPSFTTPPCTYFNDKTGLVTSLGGESFKSHSLKWVFLPSVVSTGGFCFTDGSGNQREFVYIPLCTNLGGTSGDNSCFIYGLQTKKIYCHPSLATNNGGAPDGDIAYAISQGATVRYVTNFTAPNPVTDLSAGTIYNTAVQLNFTAPSSTNAIDYYELYNNGVFMKNITASGDYLTGLTPSTSHTFTLVAVDIFYNKSVVSNSLIVSTSSGVITDLSTSIIYNTSVLISFTEKVYNPTLYKVYLSGVFYQNLTDKYITGLSENTNYPDIVIKSVDGIYGEISSNSINVTTTNVSDAYYPISDSSASDFLTASGITDTTISNSIIYLAFQLKNKSLWTKQKAVYPIVGGSASTHKWNLKDPRDLDVAFRLNIPASGYTHTSTGMKGTVTGCNTYLKPSTQLSLNNTSLSFYSRDNASGGYVEMGAQATLYIASNFSNTNYMAVNNSDSNQGTGINMQAFIQSSRISSTEMKLYRNGVLTKTASVNSTGLNTNNIFIIGYGSLPTARECAFASIGEGMTNEQATTFYNIIQQFQTMLSRQV